LAQLLDDQTLEEGNLSEEEIRRWSSGRSIERVSGRASPELGFSAVSPVKGKSDTGGRLRATLGMGESTASAASPGVACPTDISNGEVQMKMPMHASR
jgi:hypothetical protein